MCVHVTYVHIYVHSPRGQRLTVGFFFNGSLSYFLRYGLLCLCGKHFINWAIFSNPLRLLICLYLGTFSCCSRTSKLLIQVQGRIWLLGQMASGKNVDMLVMWLSPSIQHLRHVNGGTEVKSPGEFRTATMLKQGHCMSCLCCMNSNSSLSFTSALHIAKHIPARKKTSPSQSSWERELNPTSSFPATR